MNKYSLLLLSIFALTFSHVKAQNDKDFFSFLGKQKMTAKEYIIDLFKTKDIVLFSEGNHAEIQQYNLLLEVIKDPYFVENVGAIYLEVVPINHSKTINSFLNTEGYDSIQAYNETTKLYQLGCIFHLWNCYSYPWLVYNLYKFNETLDKANKMHLYGCDMEFDWTNCKTKEDYEQIYPLFEVRDSIMAENFINQFNNIQQSRNGKKKALIIMNSRHGYLKDTHRAENEVRKNTGRYLHDKYKNNIASVFMMSPGHPNNWEEYTLVHNGKWDAIFELTGKTNTGFNFKNSPFGKDKFDQTPVGWSINKYRYQDVYTGMVYYKPIEEHLLKRGWDKAITDEFKPELIRRMRIMGFDEETIKNELIIENTVRTQQHYNIEEFRKKIDFWKNKLKN